MSKETKKLNKIHPSHPQAAIHAVEWNLHGKVSHSHATHSDVALTERFQRKNVVKLTSIPRSTVMGAEEASRTVERHIHFDHGLSPIKPKVLDNFSDNPSTKATNDSKIHVTSASMNDNSSASVISPSKTDNSYWQDLLLPKSNALSRWNELTTFVHDRKDTWINRNTKIISEAMIKSRSHLPSIDAKTASNYKHLAQEIERKLSANATPVYLISEKDLNPVNSIMKRYSLYCSLCMRMIPPGPYRLTCRGCDVVCHYECIKNGIDEYISACTYSNYYNKIMKDLITKHGSSLDGINLKDIVWYCNDCNDDIGSTNCYYLSKQIKTENFYKETKATLILQSFCRMALKRSRFKKLRRGMRGLQRCYRRMKDRLREVNNQLNSLRPIRIRLHDIRGLIHDNISGNDNSLADELPIELPSSIDYGSIKCITYERSFCSMGNKLHDTIDIDEHNKDQGAVDMMASNLGVHPNGRDGLKDRSNCSETNRQRIHIEPNIADSITANKQKGFTQNLPSEIAKVDGSIHPSDLHKIPPPPVPANRLTRVNSNHNIETSSVRDNQRFDLMTTLRNGNVYQPNYATPSRTLLTYPTGQMMLTIALYSSNANALLSKANQTNIDMLESSYRFHLLQRIDIPLKKLTKNERLTIDILESHGINIDELPAGSLEKVLSEYTYADFQPARSYVLFPACNANVMIKMLISQVTTWPQAIVVGKCSMKIKDILLWRRTATFQNSLESCMWVDIPPTDEFNKMKINTRKQHNTKYNKHTNANARRGSVPSQRRASLDRSKGSIEEELSSVNGSVSESTINGHKYVKERGQSYSNAFISWTIIPFTDEGENYAGIIETRTQVRQVDRFPRNSHHTETIRS